MTYVFLHGLGQLPSSWDEVTAHLPSDIQICCPRLTAIIKNQKVTYETLYSAFENKCSLIEKPLNLCGISLGAVLALQYAINNPQMVKSLILIAPQYRMPKLLLTIQNIIFSYFAPKGISRIGIFKKRGNCVNKFNEVDRLYARAEENHLPFFHYLRAKG